MGSTLIAKINDLAGHLTEEMQGHTQRWGARSSAKPLPRLWIWLAFVPKWGRNWGQQRLSARYAS